MGDNTAIEDKLELNLSGLRIEPMRWIGTKDAQGNYTSYTLDTNGNRQLEWNTIDGTGADVTPPTEIPSANSEGKHIADEDLTRRLKGGNIYGGCYSSGHIDGNVVININGTILNRWNIFDEVTSGSDILYTNIEKKDFDIKERHSGVLLDAQGMDPLGRALNVFGGGYGEETEIWGSTTINLTQGYTFQIFGGSENGAIGKGTWNNTDEKYKYSDTYDPRFSCTINVHGTVAGAPRSTEETMENSTMAAAEFIYGGGFEGPVLGDTRIYLGNGRVFNTFAGSVAADIWGHTETYIGQNSAGETGFPWVRDNTYGANDLGGRIRGEVDFTTGHLSEDLPIEPYNTGVTTASAYTEYVQGRVGAIFGGCYGDYNYESEYSDYATRQPNMVNAFVNFKPNTNANNSVSKIFGAGQGAASYNLTDKNEMQDRSYVLIDIADTGELFADMEVFGAGMNCGVGMGVEKATADANADGMTAAAIIDLARGQIGAAYGGSLNEGVTRRTIVNVPESSTIKIGSIFAGAYGSDIYLPCDVYEGTVNYHSNSENAYLIYNPSNPLTKGAIYGGNNLKRRTLYGKINIDVPVRQKHPTYGMTTATVYGAGCGSNTWSEYTQVNLESGAKVWEVYGGGEAGGVMSAESVEKYVKDFMPEKDEQGEDMTLAKWKSAWTLGGSGYDPASFDLTTNPATFDYANNEATNLSNALVRTAEMDDRTTKTYKYNTNVIIKEGAYVGNYAYGGGLGKAEDQFIASGDVYGTTYIALLGGEVYKDLYAAGTRGTVYNLFGADFIASANAYIKGGTCRNVYGGGWAGAVGRHSGTIDAATTEDIPGETHVIIGDLNGTSFTNGIPAIQRNAYGGGEGGPVYGTANITLNNGYIGYVHLKANQTQDAQGNVVSTTSTDEHYEEKINDETNFKDGVWIGKESLYDSGCIFGGGYVDNSNVDFTNVKMYGGHVRNALFGGGEIAAIGRGKIELSGELGSVRTLEGIYKAGKTNVELWEGHVYRNVFGGGRGYNNLGEGGTLYSDGYVFGQTRVNIYGGEVGTEAGVEINEDGKGGYGNVFGGGDIGYVYSAYTNDSGQLCFGKKSGTRYDYNDETGEGDEGYYYEYEEGSFRTVGGEKILTEDCMVLIEPQCRALADVKVNSVLYKKGDYIPADALNTLKNKNASTEWSSIDPTGIIIHNAVFAGGNTSSGSASVYANATTVFGNATAAIQDIYHRDLITLGTGHNGGLYGDGNLTFVDGFRGLNITNYGTDYYSIKEEITLEQYENLPKREAAYYELKYKCIQECTDDDGTTYHPKDESDPNSKASTLTADDILSLFKNEKYKDDNGDNIIVLDGSGKKVPNPDYWTENGVLPVYAGRPMNTIQRADFCGVFGSRMVMQGAQDRVPEIVDYTNYTINRVREVSLNKVISTAGDSPENKKDYLHGNYFGIYNTVNFLGALTSDVNFGDDGTTGEHPDVGTGDPRTTDNTDDTTYGPQYEGQTFFGWKQAHINDRKRNNGSSHNKVALASGVYLELTTEQSTGDDLYDKVWGYITGVIELDLINVQTGIGGGFVYARNVHGKRNDTGRTHITTTLNQSAVSNKMFTYESDDDKKHEWQTSGNFVHSTQTIIDDCYNISGKYKTKYKEPDGVPAHYWYIKGQVYVYDQYISAYTGAPNAYSEKVDIPLTITAASHGSMKLLNIQPNRYAFWKSDGVELEEGQKLVINDITYYKNDPIDYWTWSLLNAAEKNLFAEDTYVTIAACKLNKEDESVIKAESVYLKESTDTRIETYTTLRGKAPKKDLTPDDGIENEVPSVWHVEKQEYVPFDHVFRSSNNLSHDTGYILTYRVNNPTNWNTWYTEKNDIDNNREKPREKDQTGGTDYEDGPTYRLKISSGGKVLGQREYSMGNIIAKAIYDTYTENVSGKEGLTGQAEFGPASIVTSEVTIGNDTWYPGTTVSASVAETLTGHVENAYICTHTIQLSPTEYIYMGSKMGMTERTKYKNDYPELASEIDEDVVPAYYCTKAGLYGGNYYEAGKNYRGLEAWSSMLETDRNMFTFNYDALDLLIDPAYSLAQGFKFQYDSYDATLAGAEANAAHYSLEQPVDYTASYTPETSITELSVSPSISVKRDGVTTTVSSVKKDDELSRDVFESLHNEQRHYAAINVNSAGTYYVVKAPFQIGNTPYAVGTTISSASYSALSSEDQGNIAKLNFTEDQENTSFYFCREQYTIATSSLGVAVTGLSNVYESGGVSGSYIKGSDVPVGAVINKSDYDQLVEKNQQKDFVIHGIAPTETSTLFVSRNSDIFDLSKDKIITVVYQYDYDENDASGNVTPVSERHVLNIHIKFKSGVPSVEDIKTPQIVLPGSRLGMREPNVTPGAYEVTGGGWELFEKKSDVESHTNGIEYSPLSDKLFYYQNDYYLAYYALTYLGKTYSNDVQISVANYHDLADVMSDKEHHYYIDHKDVDRKPKIYINDYSSNATPQNGLDMFKDLIDLSHKTPKTDSETGEVIPFSSGNLEGHMPLDLTHTDKPMKGGEYLEFFMHCDLDHSGSVWTPIANGDAECFEGVLHGDGYTISGLDHSLFNHLCGSVYNLGVTGTFTGGGIAETGEGYVENCWISTSNTGTKTAQPVIGAPLRSDEDDYPIQMVNCYYQEEGNATNKYTNHTSGEKHGVPTRKDAQAFYNGEVAYDLNGFYLFKRYNDNRSGGTTTYKYWLPDNDTPQEGKYDANDTNAKYCSSGVRNVYLYGGYVEDRFADGDFIYAGGTIPESNDARLHVIEENATIVSRNYYPIWPDDYLFFGQMLTYGYVENRPHQSLPTHINKSGGRLETTTTNINRVYRAPAYFRSSNMGMAHYNPYAIFAAQSADGTRTVYPNMTAIDFKGYNDGSWALGSESSSSLFYPPLLDNDGLTFFRNVDLTRNLLVYLDPAAESTANAVNVALREPAYSESNEGYRRVDIKDGSQVYGHPIEWEALSSGFIAQNDQLLIDKQDFNAPIEYSFASGKRMYHQRTPDLYVDLDKGWESISLPFTAELVTTQDKGEITHFYSGSHTVNDAEGEAKIGHEYWLREYVDMDKITPARAEEIKALSGKEYAEAIFNYPDNDPDPDSQKNVTNTFLWDYYYQGSHSHKDANADTYQTYYNSTRAYEGYPLLTNGKPYLIGFPGVTYYEFDLSGNFEAKTTAATAPVKLSQQVITFASSPALTIGISDDETTGVTFNGYTFRPSYLNEELAAGINAYTMKTDGSEYVKVPATGDAVSVEAFRPYFVKATSGARDADYIVFNNAISSFGNAEADPSKEDVPDGSITFLAQRGKVVTHSSLRTDADVNIFTTSGLLVTSFTIKPDETIETPINLTGIYIARAAGGRYTQKLSVK